MSVSISGTSSVAYLIATNTPHILLPTASRYVSSGDAIRFNNGDMEAGMLTVAGFASSDGSSGSAAVSADGFDLVNVSQTGQLYAYNPSSNALEMFNGGNIANIAGQVFSNDIGIFSVASDFRPANAVTITATGLVQGGSELGLTYRYSAAIVMISLTDISRLTNYGTIIGDENSAGDRNAVANAISNPIGTRNFDDLTPSIMDFVNGGTVHGDILLQAGGDIVTNFGTIFGDVFLMDDNDRYDGRGGRIVGTIEGGDGADTLIGGNEYDVLRGDAGDDRMFGLGDGDRMSGGTGEDTLNGGAGHDELYGGSNGDEIFGGSGDDYIDGGSGSDEIFGNSGDDTIDGGSAFDTIDGGSGDDDISGGDQADLISGRSGDDFMRGDGGNDSIGGGSGADTIAGGADNDSVDAGSGDDRIFGGSGDDTIGGSLGSDFIDGGSGEDSLSGGSDNDTLNGGAGQDRLSGGWGADVFEFDAISDSASGSATRDTITDFEAGLDKIDLSDIGSLVFVASFSNSAGEVRYNDAVGRLYIDDDGDGTSDFQLDLGAGAGLTVDDLIL